MLTYFSHVDIIMLHVDIKMSHINITMLHVEISKLHANINKLHVNISKLHGDNHINYFACRQQELSMPPKVCMSNQGLS